MHIATIETHAERTAVENPAERTFDTDDALLLDSLSTRIAVLDGRGTVMRVNEAWRAAGRDGPRGMVSRPIVGRSYLHEVRRAEAHGYEGAEEIRQGIEAVLMWRMTTFRGEFRWPPENRWYEMTVDALRRAAGGVVLSLVDVTDRRRADALIEVTRRHAAHLGRTTMMSEIASTLAQEIKQPMAAIQLNALAGATLLGSPRTAFDAIWSDSREAWQMFKDIYDDASRVSGVIEHVHKHVRRQGVQPGVVDIADTCRTAAKLLEHEAELRDARIDLDLEPGIPTIVGDAIEIQQIVMSLAQNALEAVAASSERVVTIGVAAQRCGTEVELYVRDTGPGLGPLVRQHLFESFFTTKECGLGMGLIIVRSIAERHRGRVSAEDVPNRDRRGGGGAGAIFRVHLPVS